MAVDLDVVALVTTFRTDNPHKPVSSVRRKHLRAFPVERFAALEAWIVERSAEVERSLIAQKRRLTPLR
ncbi:hypothetical protein [Pengzhenrongella sp.]|jgi:hypothetical protein|uniref:hypothetical protein n=1 Tax=Pengzhenrongella sp. TaxID=2888820 RepID=UPI002F956E83